MADTKESELARHLEESRKGLEVYNNFHKETPKRSDANLEKVYAEVYLHTQGILTTSEISELKNPDSSYRYSIAMQALNKMAAQRAGQSASGKKDTGHTKGAAAAAYVDILKNKDKYGLEGKTEEEVLEAAWYSTETNDRLHPDQIKGDLIQKKQAERRALLEQKIKDKKALEMQYQVDAAKIAAQGPTEKELRDARREATIAYLEAQQADKVWAGTTSNSMGELYSAESIAMGAAAMGKAGNFAGLNEKIGGLGEKVGAVNGLLKAGKYVEVFSNPSGYFASKAGRAITKLAADKASAWAIKAALAVGLNAVAPVVGQLAAELASRVLGPLMQKAIRGSINRAKNALKKAGMSIIGLGILLGSAVGSGLATGAGTVAVTSVVLVPFVAFIMFIINASGYVVPPGPPIGSIVDDTGSGNVILTGSGSRENEYIRVVKTPNPTGPFQNSVLPFEVTYTIEIQAKKSTLTNIELSFGCDASKDNAPINCPSTSIPITEIERAPIQIAPGTPYIIRYSMTYGSLFANSITRDSLTVSAKAEGANGTQVAAGAATTVFGQPATECFVFGAGWESAPAQKNMMYSSLGLILSQRGYVNKLCTGGNINLLYSPTPSPNGWYGRHTSSNRGLTFFPPAFGNQPQLDFVFAHESGHALQFDTPDTVGLALFQDFKASFPPDFICSYPVPFRASANPYEESFAEMIGLYIVNSSASTSPRTYPCFAQIGNKDGTFKGAYPTYWNFANTKIF